MHVWILYHPRERLSKCTLRPLWGRDDMHLTTWPAVDPIPADVLLLHVDGAPITMADRGRTVLLVDGTWRQALRMGTHLGHFAKRSVVGFRTAFPRKSRVYPDPVDGLGSSEALWAAALCQGDPDDGWLAGYYWREEFLARNRALIERLQAAGGLTAEHAAELTRAAPASAPPSV